MVKLRGPSLGRLDPTVLALRDGYVAYHDRLADQWRTDRNDATWTAERELWTAGEAMILRTGEVFDAAVEAGMDNTASSFTFAHDPFEERLWQLPGVEGGQLFEVAVVDGAVVTVGPPDDPRSIRLTRSQIARKGGNARWTNGHGQ